MIKNPEIRETDDENRPRRGKRKKKPTQCKDARRMFGRCGICGSENVVNEGVRHCTKCGKEAWYLVTGRSWWRDTNKIPFPCGCKETIKQKGYPKGSPPRYYIRRFYEYYEVKACADCGAVKGSICPNCKKPLWFGKFRKFCKNCGYQYKYTLKED